jgi:hypothetical protein
VEVCLKNPVPLDTYSGFVAKKAGYQHLTAKMALAFVRQRHGLTNGDLDRTHRQQAFLDSVMQQLRTEGVLSDLGKINSLLSVAKQYVITDSGWDLLDFATQMRSLNSSNLTFHTLPIVAYATIAGQSANQVDPALIQKLVQETFYPAPAASGSARPKPANSSSISPAVAARTTVDVYNGGSTPGLAGQVSDALVKDGFTAGLVGNTGALSATQVLYGTGSSASGGQIAKLFGVSATASTQVAAGHVQVMLGGSAAVPGATPSSSASVVPLPTTGVQGGAVNAKNGIPCVD